MANLLLTGRCNRRCAYCFAQSRRPGAKSSSSRQSPHLSLSAVPQVLDFARRSKLRSIGLLGGEPTLNPHFPELLDQLLGAGLSVTLFTGGLLSPRLIRCLQSRDPERLTIVFNLPAAGDGCSARVHQQVRQSIQQLGSWSSISYTIWRADFDAEAVASAVAQSGMKGTLRLGLAVPSLDGAGEWLSPSAYPQAGGLIANLAEACHSRGVKVSFDCGFTRCMFTEVEMQRLRNSQCETRFVCSPIVDIDTDLKVHSCLPLAEDCEVNLDEFATRGKIIQHFESRQAPYRSFGIYERCHECPQKLNNECAGGCLALVMRSFQRASC
jgi:hypothetical protein